MVVSAEDRDSGDETLDVPRSDRHLSVTNSAPPEQFDAHSAGDLPTQHQGGVQGYLPLQRRLHWIVAALVGFQLLLGLLIGTMSGQPQNHASLRNILIVHLITGTVIFGLVCKRLSLRRRFGAPPPPEGTPMDAAVLARSNHLGFYVLLLALPVFGWLAYLSGRPAASAWGAIHGGLALVLVLAICAHLSGVVYHQYIRRDGLLRRMSG